MKRAKTIRNYGIAILLIVLLFPCLVSAQKYSWKQKANYGGGPTRSTQAFSIGDKIYVGPGHYPSGNQNKEFWEYNTVTNVWTRKADFDDGGGMGVGFSINGKGYITLSGTNGTWEYDPVTDVWIQKASFPGGRNYAAGFVIGNKAYVGTGNGHCPMVTYCRDFWEFDPLTNKWTQKEPFPGVARYGAVGFSIGNFGYMGTGAFSSGYSDFYKYDPATNTWSAIADFPGGKRVHASSFVINNKGYVGIGMELPPDVATKDFWEYDPLTDMWTQKEDFGGGERSYSVSAATSTKGYLGTGSESNGPFPGNKDDFWEYSPEVSDTIPHIVLEMPTVFTPNNDGMNDVFRPLQMAGVKDATLKVYNRWGQKMIETNDLYKGWDGTNKNNSCTEGIYFWLIDYITVADEPKALKGFVTIFN